MPLLLSLLQASLLSSLISFVLKEETVTPWYPILKDFESDMDAFYSERLNRPLPQVK
ncbi:acetone carboxylase subunit gamma [Peribacillus asahii]|uniref:acetone carboxylase subunit gamma n=1 Tax=Peribacillus asahii TaxID=228899 RepID=UPI0035A5F753